MVSCATLPLIWPSGSACSRIFTLKRTAPSGPMLPDVLSKRAGSIPTFPDMRNATRTRKVEPVTESNASSSNGPRRVGSWMRSAHEPARLPGAWAAGRPMLASAESAAARA